MWDEPKTRTMLLTVALPEWYAEDFTQEQADEYYRGDLSELALSEAPILSPTARLTWLYGSQDSTGLEESRVVILGANVVPYEAAHDEEEDERLTEALQEREDNLTYLRERSRKLPVTEQELRQAQARIATLETQVEQYRAALENIGKRIIDRTVLLESLLDNALLRDRDGIRRRIDELDAFKPLVFPVLDQAPAPTTDQRDCTTCEHEPSSVYDSQCRACLHDGGHPLWKESECGHMPDEAGLNALHLVEFPAPTTDLARLRGALERVADWTFLGTGEWQSDEIREAQECARAALDAKEAPDAGTDS